MKSVIALFLLLLVSPVWAQNQGDEFPANALWLNSDYPSRLQMLTNKGVAVVVWHPEATEVVAEVQRMQEITAKYPYIQLISVWFIKASEGMSRGRLLDYIQEYGIGHPVVITDNLSTIRSFSPIIPSAMIYRNATTPEFTGEGLAMVELARTTLEEWVKTPSVLSTMTPWQVRPSVDPMRYADPLVEQPSSLSITSNGEIVVSEPSHHRILLVGGDGTPQTIFGNGQPGYADGAGFSTQLRNPSGTTWKSASNELIIADPGNNRIRVADPANFLMYTMVGNGKEHDNPLDSVKGALTAVGMPVDVELTGRKLYVLTATTNQLLELEPQLGYGKAIADFPMDRRVNGHRATVSRLSSGSQGIYTVMTDGSVWLSQRKEQSGVMKWSTNEIYNPDKRTYIAGAVCEMRGKVFIADPVNHVIGILKDGEITVISGSAGAGWKDGKGAEAQFSRPMDIVAYNGRLLIADAGNHVLRSVHPKNGKTTTIGFQPVESLLLSSEVLASGDQMYSDSLLVGMGENRITVKMDLQGWTLVADGRNEVVAEVTGGIGIENEQLTGPEFTALFYPEASEGYAQFEIFLTLRSPVNPKLIVTKKIIYGFQVDIFPDAPKSHEQSIRVRIFPE
jgi:hypothetical protein